MTNLIPHPALRNAVLVAVCLGVRQTAGQEPTSRPQDAVRFSIADLSTLPEDDRSFQRYVWWPSYLPQEDKWICSPVVQMVASKADVALPLEIPRPEKPKPPVAVVAGGHLFRFDLRALAPGPEDFARLYQLWEDLAQSDPYFHHDTSRVRAFEVELTHVFDGPARDAGLRAGDRILAADGEPFSSSDEFKLLSTFDEVVLSVRRGVTVESVTVEPRGRLGVRFIAVRKKDFGAVYGRHVGQENIPLLIGLSDSNSSIVRADWLLNLLLWSIEEEGGLYYKWKGIEDAANQSQSKFFARTGANRDESKAFGGIYRTWHASRGPTEKEGITETFRSRVGWAFLTLDPKRGYEAVADQTPSRNLLDYENHDFAREAIQVDRRGFLEFALFTGSLAKGGAGQRAESAPDNVAPDPTRDRYLDDFFGGPTADKDYRLVPPISCMRCHVEAGLRPLTTNQAKELLTGKYRVFDDLSNLSRSKDEQLDQLASQFLRKDPETYLERARTDYNATILLATGGRMNAEEYHEAVGRTFNRYRYPMVSTHRALIELGYEVAPDKAIEAFNQIIPERPEDIDGISPVDTDEGKLRKGIPISRGAFEQIFPDLAGQAYDHEREAANVE